MEYRNYNDNDNPIYDYSTVSGKVRRLLRRVTWKNLLWGAPVLFVVLLAVILLSSRSSSYTPTGSRNVLLLGLSPGNDDHANHDIKKCDEEDVKAAELEQEKELEQCITPHLQPFLKHDHREKNHSGAEPEEGNKNKTHKHEHEHESRDHKAPPICIFLNSIQCSKRSKSGCARHDAFDKFDTYINRISETTCSHRQNKLIALIESGGETCHKEYPRKVAECIHEEFNPAPENKTDSDNETDYNGCRPVMAVHRCLDHNTLICGRHVHAAFKTTFRQVETWIHTVCHHESHHKKKTPEVSTPTTKPETTEPTTAATTTAVPTTVPTTASTTTTTEEIVTTTNQVNEEESKEKDDLIKKVENQIHSKYDIIKKLEDEIHDENDLIKKVENEIQDKDKDDVAKKVENEIHDKDKDDVADKIENEIHDKDKNNSNEV